MSMTDSALFGSERHYAPPDVNWDETTVTRAIRSITDDVISTAVSGKAWPPHSLDDGASIEADFYFGKGGSLWAIDHLIRRGYLRKFGKKEPTSLIQRTHRFSLGRCRCCL